MSYAVHLRYLLPSVDLCPWHLMVAVFDPAPLTVLT